MLVPVLPKRFRERLINELDKRLDYDIDEILESPKLRLQLSPAQLDNSLLELYNKVVEGPSGDVFRVIGGGGQIGLQNMYMKRQAARKSRKSLMQGGSLDLFPTYNTNVDAGEDRKTAAQSVRRVLSRNLPGKKDPSMCFGVARATVRAPQSWTGLRAPSRSGKFSLLI